MSILRRAVLHFLAVAAALAWIGAVCGRIDESNHWSWWLLLAPVYVPAALAALAWLLNLMICSWLLWRHVRSFRRHQREEQKHPLRLLELGFVRRSGLAQPPQPDRRH